jgi:hypothetical protein
LHFLPGQQCLGGNAIRTVAGGVNLDLAHRNAVSS